MGVYGNPTLLSSLDAELKKGLLVFKDFKAEGIPGKIKTYKKIESNEELILFMKQIQKSFPQFDISINEEETKKCLGIPKQYTFLKWNGEYGGEAKFIVRDNYTQKQSLFIPGRCDYLFWVQSDLANDEVVTQWDKFGNESIDDLGDVAM